MINAETIPALAESVKPTARLHVNSPYTYYGEAEASPVTQGVRAEMTHAEVEERYYYINHTHLPITISRRDGLPMTVAPQRSNSSSDFVVRRILVLKGHALQSVLANLQALSELDSRELDVLRHCFKNVAGGTYREASVMLDFTISLKDLQSKGGNVYHYQLDLAISTKESSLAPAHPYSHRFLNIGGFGETTKYKDQREFNLKIRYVDHSPTASRKYVNIAGRVFVLNPQRDAPYGRISGKVNGKPTERIFPDYLEIFYSANADPHLVDNTGVAHARVAIAEAKESVGLFDTYEEAQNAGNIEAVHKERLARATRDVETLRANIAREKAELEREELVTKTKLTDARRQLEEDQARYARENFELDQKRQALQAERKKFDEDIERERREHEARLKRENLQWREYYEMRSMERRDSSELLKYIPTLILGVVSLAAAWAKISGQAKTA